MAAFTFPVKSDISTSPQLNGLTITGTDTATIDVALSKIQATLQTKVVGTAATGTWQVLVSNDLVDFVDITSSFAPALNQPAALTGTQYNFATLPAVAMGWAYLRLVYTNASGTSVLTVSVRTRGN